MKLTLCFFTLLLQLFLLHITIDEAKAQNRLPLIITEIQTDKRFVSQGQTGVVVSIMVENPNASEVTDIDGFLYFVRSDGLDLSSEYDQTRTDDVSVLAGREQTALTFEIDIPVDATLGTVQIDGAVSGITKGIAVTTDTAEVTAEWQVQVPAELKILSVKSPVDTVARGQIDVPLTVRIKNTAGVLGAGANISELALMFRESDDDNNLSDGFFVEPNGANPQVINGNEELDFSFVVDVDDKTTRTTYRIDAAVDGFDSNSGISIQDNAADSTWVWEVVDSEKLQILAITPSVQVVNAGQTEAWNIRLTVENNDKNDIAIDFNSDRTFVEFSIDNTDVGDEYEIVQPIELNSGGVVLKGKSTGYIDFLVTGTGLTDGLLLLGARVEGQFVKNQEIISDFGPDLALVTVVNPDIKIYIEQTDAITLNYSAETALVNTSQQFNIDVTVSNDLNESIDDLVLELSCNGKSEIRQPIISAVLQPLSSTTFTYTVVASADATGDLPEIFTSKILGGTRRQLQVAAPIATAQDSTALVKIQTPAALAIDFTAIAPFHVTGELFSVSAKVENLGQADVDNSGEILLTVPIEYTLLPVDPAQRGFSIDSLVSWQITAPPVVTSFDSFFVKIVKIPSELNTGLPAVVTTVSDTAFTETVHDSSTSVAKVVIDSVRIVAPQGAVDGVLSVDQALTVEAYLHRQQTVDVSVQIDLPSAFNLIGEDEFSKGVADDEGDTISVSWEVQAPNDVSPNHYISVQAFGQEADTGNLIKSAIDTVRSVDNTPVAVQIVDKARLRLVTNIIDPPSARDSTLTVNQIFTISSSFENVGGANAKGIAEMELVLPSGFSSTEPLLQSYNLDTEPAMFWHIRAPEFARSITVFTIRVTKPPDDENSNLQATILRDQVTIPVTVEEARCLILKRLTADPFPTVVRGSKDLALLNLAFENPSAMNVLVKAIDVTVVDETDADLKPDMLLNEIKIIDLYDTHTVYSTLSVMTSENPMQCRFEPGLLIPPGEVVSLSLTATIKTDTDYSNFRMAIESPQTDIFAINDENVPVQVGDLFCLPVSEVSSGISKLVDPGFDVNFYNFPNPFGSPDRVETNFNYYLEQNTDVSLRIYTLMGELVWSRTFSNSEPEGLAGLHNGFENPTIVWNGKNGRGQKVLNGVYIAVIKTPRERAITKVAVAR